MTISMTIIVIVSMTIIVIVIVIVMISLSIIVCHCRLLVIVIIIVIIMIIIITMIIIISINISYQHDQIHHQYYYHCQEIGCDLTAPDVMTFDDGLSGLRRGDPSSHNFLNFTSLSASPAMPQSVLEAKGFILEACWAPAPTSDDDSCATHISTCATST